MSSKLINAVIALIEDRTVDAREMLRSPEVRVSSSELISRLYSSLGAYADKEIKAAMKDVLQASLRVNAKEEAKRLRLDWNESHEEAYLQGVSYVESILENYIGEFKSQILAE